MEPVQQWLSSILWSEPILMEMLREERRRLPLGPGVYVFTAYSREIRRDTGIFYVGKAKSLRPRVSSYLVSPDEIRLLAPRRKDGSINSSLRHAGKVQLLTEIMQKTRGPGESGVWVRWHERVHPAQLEKLLIQTLRPAFNSVFLK